MQKITIIHHGAVNSERKLELTIKMMKYLDPQKYELYLMLVPEKNNPYFLSLKGLARQFSNVHFVNPVPTNKIAKEINRYDIGLFLIPPTNFNYAHCLPNKFFEFVQARLAIAVGDSPEMKSYIEKYGLGVSAKKNTAKAMAEEIARLSEADIMSFKQKSHKYAKELSSEVNMQKIRDIVKDLSNN